MVATASVSDLAAELAEQLARISGVRLALLFGSRARGSEREDSDLDLAVDAPGVDTWALSASLSARLGVTVDVVRLDDVTIPLLHALIRDGVVVFEGARGAAADWRSRALTELETDLPWYRRMRDAWLARVARAAIRMIAATNQQTGAPTREQISAKAPLETHPRPRGGAFSAAPSLSAT